MKIRFRTILMFIIITIMINYVSALPEMLDQFNIRYDTFKTKLDTCETCHSVRPLSTCGEICHKVDKPEKVDELNNYGRALKKNLNKKSDDAFKSIEKEDSDKDNISNIDEINNHTEPGANEDIAKIK